MRQTPRSSINPPANETAERIFDSGATEHALDSHRPCDTRAQQERYPMRYPTVLVLMLIGAAAPALANDTSAELAAGGLVFVHHDAVEMRSEQLFISTAPSTCVSSAFRSTRICAPPGRRSTRCRSKNGPS